MKISKVNHTKTGVSVHEHPQGEGILYRHPKKDGEEIGDTSRYIQEERNKTAKRLYSLFVEYSIRNKEEAAAYRIEKIFFDKWSKKYLMKERSDAPVLSKKDRIRRYSSKQAVTSFVNGGLRNSLRRSITLDTREKIYVPDILAKMMYLAVLGQQADEIRRQVTPEVFDAVAEFVREDYAKERCISNISHSIENNSTKVGTVDLDGRVLLQLSNAEHPGKKYIFRFIKEYAASDEEHQRGMLIHIRRLILLYFQGEEACEKAEVQEWSFGTPELDDAVVFSEEAMKLIHDIAQVPKEEKVQKRVIADRLKVAIRDEIAFHYREAVKWHGIREDEGDIFWLRYFERIAEKETKVRDSLDPGKLSVRYLCNLAWKEWVSFIAMKYIDMGKAVYHFAMSDLGSVEGQKSVEIGKVHPCFENGISSFDYERVKAKESLERDLSQYITFAVNNFAKAVCSEEFRAGKNNEDILQVKEAELYPDVRYRVMQYFGGESIWKDSTAELYEDEEVFLAFQKALADLRNSNFHYTASFEHSSGEKQELISDLMDEELLRVGNVFRKKYYSNNTLMFYREEDVTGLMTRLYRTYKMRPAQIPAFQNIVSKGNLAEVITGFVKGRNKKNIYSVNQGYDLAKNFEGALYFILKEIYYYDFLQLEDLTSRFCKALEEMENSNREALDNFQSRLKEIHYEKLTFGEICQYIMTDYNQQNNDKQKHVSAREKTVIYKGKEQRKVDKVRDKNQRYKHFRTLLYLGIRRAYLDYLKNDAGEIYGFLREPEYKEDIYQKIPEEQFCNHWECLMYESLKDEEDPVLQSYYVCAHFMNPKYLNHLAGSIKNYLRYRMDIERRAESTGNGREGIWEEIKSEQRYYENVLRMLEFCLIFSGQVSGRQEDYFRSDEEYAAYMGRFIQYGKYKEYDVNPLKLFCEEDVYIRTANPNSAGKQNGGGKGKKPGKVTRKIGTYYDGLNPVLNRNIVLAKLYGDTSTVSACMEPITKEKDFLVYYNEIEELDAVFHRGYCETEDEQRRLRTYQNHKNRIEMVDVLVCSELINDLQGQLVSWAYLRERDLMYLQLGYYYVKLYHTDSVPKEHWMRQLRGVQEKVGDGNSSGNDNSSSNDNGNSTGSGNSTSNGNGNGNVIDIIDGAILYQIAAMYTYELPVYELKNGVAYVPKKNSSTGSNVSRFINRYCQGDREEREKIYLEGLCFFENVDRHDELVELRNYVDHFKYFVLKDKSILELYSQMYESFMAYDVKFKKSVTYILKNILLRYFVDAKLTMGYQEKRIESNGAKNKAEREKRIRSIYVTDIRIEEGDLHSDYFTCKTFVKDGNKLAPNGEALVKVREDEFLELLRKIMMYKVQS